jgi:hypothetical protein
LFQVDGDATSRTAKSLDVESGRRDGAVVGAQLVGLMSPRVAPVGLSRFRLRSTFDIIGQRRSAVAAAPDSASLEEVSTA